MKLLPIAWLLIASLVDKNLSLDANDYVIYVDELSRSEEFVDRYANWSLELFSQADYLYGDAHKRFPCPMKTTKNDAGATVSVHRLRPRDVTCIGAMGDGWTTGLAAQAVTPIGLLSENRGKLIRDPSLLLQKIFCRHRLVDWW